MHLSQADVCTTVCHTLKASNCGLLEWKQNNICRIAGLTYTSYPWLTRQHVYLKRLKIQHEIKIHALLKSEFERE